MDSQTAAVARATRGLPRLGVFAPVAIIFASVLNTLGVFTEDAIHWTNWLIAFASIALAAVIVFGWFVRRAARNERKAWRAGLVFGVLGVLTVAAFLVRTATDLRRRGDLPRRCRYGRSRGTGSMGGRRCDEFGLARSSPRCACLRQRHRFARLVHPPASSSRSSILSFTPSSGSSPRTSSMKRWGGLHPIKRTGR